MGADDALLSELGVTARGERDVARDVIRDAALAAAARAAAARRAPATADAEAAEEGDAGTGADETRGGAGGGGGADPGLPPPETHTPATRELCRLREEAGTVAAELASVRDALDDVRAKAAEGTAPADAPLVIAVGERRVAGLVEKRAALRARVRDAEALASADADAARTGVSGRAAATPAGRRGTKTETPRVAAATLAEDDDLDALLDSMSAGGPSARGGDGSSLRSGVTTTISGTAGSRNDHAGETERERLIRAGVLTPFASLDGFERRVASTSATVNPEAATAHAVAATRAWREGRSRAVLLEGDAVPQQQPAARPFARHGGARAPDVGAGARMAEKRREWRGHSDRAAAALEGGGGRKRRRRRQRDAAYSSDEEHTEEELEPEAEAEDEEGAEGDLPAAAPAPRGRERRARAPAVKREPPPPVELAAGGPAGFVIPKREPRDAVSHAPASGRGEAATRGGGAPGRWACPACTFANADGDACALCDTPRPSAAAVAADDDIEFVGEVPAPRAAAGAKASKATAVKRANGDASGANGRGSGGASAGGGAAAAPRPGAPPRWLAGAPAAPPRRRLRT